jgi:UDP-N-acetylglucosamine acyltransferase
MAIHPTAIVDAGARLGDGVDIGPYAVVGPAVALGDGCRVGSHACLQGPLELGPGCVVGFSAAIGHDPQVAGRAGPFGRTRIGARSTFREFAQVHRSMRPDGETVIGDDGYFMANVHIAHDCRIGDRVILTNNVMLAGHVEVGDRVVMGGGAGIHQFARIGELAMVTGHASLSLDAPPFCVVGEGRPAPLKGLNKIGLERAGVGKEARVALKIAYRVLFRGDAPFSERLAAVARGVPEVDRLVAFLETSKRGVIGFGGRRG